MLGFDDSQAAYFVIVGASNAVNFTDGLDGPGHHAGDLVGSALGVFAYVTGNSVFSRITCWFRASRVPAGC